MRTLDAQASATAGRRHAPRAWPSRRRSLRRPRRRRRRGPCRLLRPAVPTPKSRCRPALPARRRVRAGRPRDPRRPEPPAGQPHRPVVLVVDYRRPPEHVFPAALVDSVAALDWLIAHGAEHGVDAGRVGVVGDSAGANLAIGTALRRPGRLEAAVLVYPFLDPEAGSASYASTQRRAGPRGRAVVLAPLRRARRRPGPARPGARAAALDPAGGAAPHAGADRR